MKLYRLEVELTCIAPVLSAATGAMALGVDAAMQRDSEKRPALPGSLIKGNLRQAWTTFQKLANGGPSQKALVDDWLGGGSNDTDFEPRRARLHFSYWWSDLNWSPTGDRPLYRIRLDAETGAIAKGALQVIESPYAPGQEVTFSGLIHAWLADEAERDQLCSWLRKGFHYAQSLGANKGVGFGWVKQVKVVAKPVTATVVGGQEGVASESLGLRICPQDPFCIGKPAIGENNRFDTEEHIPGAAILGALARMLELDGRANWPYLDKHFDILRISHAVPARADSQKRALVPPLSLSTFRSHNDETELLDLVNCEQPVCIEKQSAPCFQPDWKLDDWAKARDALDHPTVDKRLEVRTAIDANTGAALTGQLYSIEAVVPNKLVWLANADFSRIGSDKERAQTRQEFEKLVAFGLYGVGKLKTRMRVSCEPPFAFSFPQRDLTTQPLDANKRVHLTLQTPALLLPPDFAPPTCGSHVTLKQAYCEVLSRLSDGCLELIYFFARHDLRGGRHWFSRFRKPAGCEHYHPLTLTLAGSVFVLKIIDAKNATGLLQGWQRYGLPQTPGAPGGENWRLNPWIRNNGYGEIAIDPALPFEKLPKGQWHEC